jgi:vacuolar-type H+-ATPase subunit D/Vma8
MSAGDQGRRERAAAEGPALAQLVGGQRAILAEVVAMRKDLHQAIEANGEWLTLAQAAKAMRMSTNTLRTAIAEAVAAKQKTIFEGIRFKNLGRGKHKPRYHVWSADLARARRG